MSKILNKVIYNTNVIKLFKKLYFTFVSSSLDKNPKCDKNNLAVLKSVHG